MTLKLLLGLTTFLLGFALLISFVVRAVDRSAEVIECPMKDMKEEK